MWKEETTEQIAVNIYGFASSSLMVATALNPEIVKE
jgi:hypothetical protein